MLDAYNGRKTNTPEVSPLLNGQAIWIPLRIKEAREMLTASALMWIGRNILA